MSTDGRAVFLSADDVLQQSTGLLQLQQVIAVTANEAASLDEAIRGALELVCAYTAWPVGHVFLTADENPLELVSSRIWFLQNPQRFAPFREESEKPRSRDIIGLPERVVSECAAIWVADLGVHPICIRREMARQVGLKTAVAVPIWSGNETVGVLEFFTDAQPPKDARLLQVLNYVGTQLGRVIERQRAQLKLRRSEDYFRSLIEYSSDIIAILKHDGVFRYISPSVKRILDYAPEEIVGCNAFEMIHPSDSPAAFQKFLEALGKPGSTQKAEFRFRHNAGGWREFETIGQSLQTTDGLLGVVVNARDITERKQAEEQLRATNEKLETVLTELQAAQEQVIQQERLRALGTMASGIAHDFNNALAPILGFSELLLDRPEAWNDLGKAAHYVKLINTAAQDAASVVRRLREFYRHRDSDELRAAVDLNRVVHEAVSLTEPKWKSQAQAGGVSIQVLLDLHPVPYFAANEADLRELLTNLIFNAIDALPEGGAITLRTRHDAENVVLEVADTGVGMPEDVRLHCLEPFFTTKGNRGSGLGLSMVYGIVQRHQGHIDISSALGRGTTFSLRFPIRLAPKPELVAPASSITPSALRVLLVEDEAPVRAIVGEMLRSLGHKVTAASCGRTALEVFAPSKFDRVLVDRAMPGMSGDQVVIALKAIAPATPVILLTGFGSMMIAAGECPEGVDLILSKPISLAELRGGLERVASLVPRLAEP